MMSKKKQACEDRPLQNGDLPRREVGPDVDRVSAVQPDALFLKPRDNIGKEAQPFLAALKDGEDFAVDLLPQPEKNLGRGKQDSGVSVMSASVHHTPVLRNTITLPHEVLLVFHDGKRVNIGPENDRTDHLVPLLLFSGQEGDNAAIFDSRVGNKPFFKRFLNEAGRFKRTA
jgi:hypothetical protein